MSISEIPVGQSALTLRPDVVATVLDEGAVLLDLQTKYFYALNPSGWAVVQLLESGTTASAVQACCARWGAPADDAARAFVESLHAFGLLEAADASLEPVDATAIEAPSPWSQPTVERQAEPLQQVIVSAFDPSIPLAE